MAAFATMDAAEARAKAKSNGFGDGTWIEAFSCKMIDGTIAVYALRRMPGSDGAWAFITDDAAV